MKYPFSESRADRCLHRWAFTLVELLVVLVIIGILALILLPAIAKFRESAETTRCAAHMRQWGGAVLLYVNDHNGDFPKANFPANTHAILAPYLDSDLTRPSELKAVYGCPVDKWKYAFNSYLSPESGLKYGTLTAPSDHIYAIELSSMKSDNRWLTYGSAKLALAEITPKPHRGRVNALFVDGHVNTSNVSELTRAQITRDSPAYKTSDEDEPLGDPKYDQ
ncbi:MAG: prepilin-type N-terminal cleavage/methylation domain-containing protein [Verrucomicrobiota bacterium JB024]|nr:prepilin-type N-terminal cleavage/methylation domain-containing protein [Verrucomicrobiota bacterium JB024]